MGFAISIPDWNSLDSVRHAHSELEAAALVFFALLVLFDVLAHLSKDEKRKTLLEKISLCFFAVAVLAEIAAYPYGQRNDRLSADMIGSLSEKAKEALADSRTALTNSGVALTKSGEAVTKAGAANDAASKAQEKVGAVAERAEDIDADLARTQYLLSGRSVTDPDSLVKQLKQYKGQTIHFGSYNSEPDESLLCGQLEAAARAAEMNVPQDTCGGLVAIGTPSTGIVVSGPDVLETMALAQIIAHTSNLGPGGVVSGIKAPEFNILVGAKPPFTIGQARGVKVQKKTPNNKIAKP